MAVNDPNKRIIDMTASEFAEVLCDVMQRISTKEEEFKPSRRFGYGTSGIAQIFNCSMTTANGIKASGKIDKAISQSGRMIAVDAELALQLMKK